MMSGRIYNYVYSPPEEPKEKVELPPILQLPPELRASFWTLVTDTTKKNIRLSCKAFKNDIDTKVGLSLILDERKFLAKDPSSTLLPSASKIHIWGSQFTPPCVNRLLLNSRLITSVSFGGPIDISNFTKIITRSPNLLSITVTDRSGLDEKIHIPLKLRTIQSLYLGAEGHIIDYRPDANPTPTPWSTYSNILTNLTLPCLKTLNIEYTSPLIENKPPSFNEILNGIFKYLITHKSITDLTLRLHKGQSPIQGLVDPKDKVEESQLDFPQDQLQSLRLKKLVADTNADAFKIWDVLLPFQDSLEHFDCLNQDKSWNYFTPIINKNAETLKVIRIRKLNPKTSSDGRIDLRAFKNCTKLEELFLTRFKNCTQEVCNRVASNYGEFPFLEKISTKLPEMIKFIELPSSLTQLKIQGFTVKSEDLTWIPLKLRNLKLLELQLLGYRGPGDIKRDAAGIVPPRDVSRHGLGVNSEIIQRIFQYLRKLDTLFIEEFYNNKTALKGFEFQEAIKKINLIPGESILKTQGYYGILIDSCEPLYDHEVPRADRSDLWDIRFNQYRYQAWIQEKLDEKNEEISQF